MVTTTIPSNSSLLSRIVYRDITDELLLALRNNIPDRKDRAETATETFTGDGSTTVFTLEDDVDDQNRHTIKNAIYVTVNGVRQTAFSDYVVGYRTNSPIIGKLQFWNAPSNGTTIVIYYAFRYHFIFEEMPRVDLTTNSYPRISLIISNVTPKDVAIGGKVQKHTLDVSITVVDIKKEFVEDSIQNIKDYFTDESVKHGFHFFDYIREPRLTGIAVNGQDPNDVVFLQQISYQIPNEFEFSR